MIILVQIFSEFLPTGYQPNNTGGYACLKQIYKQKRSYAQPENSCCGALSLTGNSKPVEEPYCATGIYDHHSGNRCCKESPYFAGAIIFHQQADNLGGNNKPQQISAGGS